LIQIIQWAIQTIHVIVIKILNIFHGMVIVHIAETLLLVVLIVRTTKHVLFVIQVDFSDYKIIAVYVLMDIIFEVLFVKFVKSVV
jgi:hypothetical protein